MIKTKKRKKVSRMHGRKMGTHGSGARKNAKGTGHRGGKGMSGSGKRADHKKTLITKKYGHGYFGKKGITSKATIRDKRQRINLKQIEATISKLGRKSGEKWEVELKNYKILGEGDPKIPLIIKAKDASASAINKVKKAGGEIILLKSKSQETKAQDAQKEKLSVNDTKITSPRGEAK